MEQIGLALILFAAFWVGCAAGYIAMRLRAQVAYEKGRSEAAAEISALTERLNGRDLQFTEARRRADTGAEAITRLETELRAEIDRRTVAEARLTLLPKYEAELESRGKKLAEQQAELTKLHVTTSELSTRLEETKRTSEDKINAIQALQSRVTESFQTMSAEALMSNNKAFLDLAGDALTRLQDSARGDLDQRQSLFGQIMEPLKSSLDRVDSRISELERDRVTAYAGLQQQVESMMRTQVSLQAETSHLASALRTPSSRGRWGEVQLRRVVELAGMISHCDFIEPRPTDDASASSRPDLIVQLPNFRQIVVDSKVSLAAYLESNDATDEASRLEKRREHAAQVRAHVTQLSAKGYWDQFPQSPEFVIAFLPGESFFSAALEFDPELLEFGVERRVILATPTTLIALLRAVAWGWKQEMVSSNAREIRDLGKALYDRLRSLADNFTEVQRGLSRTTAAFNRAVGTFESSVIPSARRMRELGASTGDEIVSPPPVDSTPRSLQLLAETTEAEGFAGTPTPLEKIGVNAAGAQPPGVSSRKTVEPATGKASQTVLVNHTAFDRQPSNAPRSAEPLRSMPAATFVLAPPVNAAKPAALPGTAKAVAPATGEPAPTPDSAKPSPRSVPVPVATPKPTGAIPVASVREPIPPTTAISGNSAKPVTAIPVPPASESPAASALEPLSAATPSAPIQNPATAPGPIAKPTVTAAVPPANEMTPAGTAASAGAIEPVQSMAIAQVTAAKPIAIAAVPSPNEPAPAVSEPTQPIAIAPVTAAKPIAIAAVPSANEPAPAASEPVQPTATAPVTAAKPIAIQAVPSANEPAPAVSEPTQPTATAAVTATKPVALAAVSSANEPAPAASDPTQPTATAPVTAAKPIAIAAVSSANEPAMGASERVQPTAIAPVTAAKPIAGAAVPSPNEALTAGASVAPTVSEPIQPTATAPVTAAKPIAIATVPSANEPAPAVSEPTQPTATTAVTAAKPIAGIAVPSPNEQPAASAAAPLQPAATMSAITVTPIAAASVPSVSSPIQLTTSAAVSTPKPAVPSAKVPVASEPSTPETPIRTSATIANPLAAPPAQQPLNTAKPLATTEGPGGEAAAPNEPTVPVFVLATLPHVVEEPVAPPPVLSASEPSTAESLKALAALYSSKPNGATESSTVEPRAQAVETPVGVAS